MNQMVAALTTGLKVPHNQSYTSICISLQQVKPYTCQSFHLLSFSPYKPICNQKYFYLWEERLDAMLLCSKALYSLSIAANHLESSKASSTMADPSVVVAAMHHRTVPLV